MLSNHSESIYGILSLSRPQRRIIKALYNFFNYFEIIVDKTNSLWYNSRVAKFDPLAQTVEHLTFNQGVRSSSLRRVTKKGHGLHAYVLFCIMRYDSNSLQSACGLDSLAEVSLQHKIHFTASAKFRVSDKGNACVAVIFVLCTSDIALCAVILCFA